MGVGEKDKITPDMIEWVVSDEKVASRYKNKFKSLNIIYIWKFMLCGFFYFRWKDIAERLGLNNYVTSIDRNYSYRCAGLFFCLEKFEQKSVRLVIGGCRVVSCQGYYSNQTQVCTKKKQPTSVNSNCDAWGEKGQKSRHRTFLCHFLEIPNF